MAAYAAIFILKLNQSKNKMERKFKVIADTCFAGNKIFNYGDEVLMSEFPAGRADVLVQHKFLKEIKQTDTGSPTETVVTNPESEVNINLRQTGELPKMPPLTDPVTEKVPESVVVSGPEQSEKKDTNKPIDEEPSIEEMVKALQKAGVKFDPNSSKEAITMKWRTLI